MLPRYSALLLLFFSLFISVPMLRAADLRLVAEFAGERYEVVGFTGRGTVVRHTDGTERVLTDVRLVLEGSTGPGLGTGYSPLFYRVERQPANHARQRAGGHLYEYRVQVDFEVGSEDTPRWFGEDASLVWPETDLQDKDFTWIVAWWDRSVGTFSSVSQNPFSGTTAHASIEIDPAELDGRPCIFLWKDGEFLPPRKYAEDPANALFTRLQRNDAPPESGLTGNDRDSQGYHWLQYAASWGNLEWIEAWLRESSAKRPKFKEETHPIHLAAMHGHAQVVAALTEAGYRPTTRDVNGFDVGHLAALWGHPPILEALLANDYNVGRNTRRGNFEPATLAMENGHDDIFGLLRTHGAKVQPLSHHDDRDALLASHVAQGHLGITRYLLEDKESNPNAIVSNCSILTFAVNSGNPAVVETLLEAGADPDPDDDFLPLAVACQREDLVIARMLLKAGANPNGTELISGAPLMHAVVQGNGELVQLLLDHGATPAIDLPPEQPLGLVEIATVIGRNGIVSDLFEAGATCRFTPEFAEQMLVISMNNDVLEMAILAFEACLRPDFRFYDEYLPNWVAHYYEADSVSDWLEAGDYGAAETPENLYHPTEADVPPKLIGGSLPPYSETLYRKYGTVSARVTVLIDEAGVPRFPKFHAADLPAELVPALYDHLRNWRFDPAIKDGRPVKVTATVPFSLRFTPPSVEVYETGELSTIPKSISQPAPHYPLPLLVLGTSGYVRLTFVIQADGTTTRVRATYSSHPLLTKSAVDAVKKWIFEPGKIGDKPVATWVNINIPFTAR